LGTAVAASGLAAFSAHASATAWAYHLDGAAIVLLTAILAAHEWRPTVPTVAVAGLGIVVAGTAALFGAPGTNLVSVVLAALVIAAQPLRMRSRRAAPALAAGALLAVGAVVRALGDSGGPWCDPGSPLQGHAVWHLLAAAALVLLVSYLRSGPLRA
jgi:hypothetical protein